MTNYTPPIMQERAHSRRFQLFLLLFICVLAATGLSAQSSSSIKLLTFSAAKKSPTSALIQWTTQLETNNNYFDVERSADAQTWAPIARRAGSSNSDTKIQYTVVDERPSVGANYYRLHRVDLDGNSSYSDMESVTFDKINTVGISIYPNPATKNSQLYIKLDGSSANEITKVTVTDIMGQLVYEDNVQGVAAYQLNAQNLRTGVYYLSVSTPTETKVTNRLLIQ